MNLTELEVKLIKAIINSDFADGDDLKSINVWLPTAGEVGCEKKQLSGIVSSLVKKNIIVTDGVGDSITVSFSKEGQEIASQFI